MYIYAIMNRFNEARYIGSTQQIPEKRWSRHKHELRRGKHHSTRLQTAWDTFGEDAFVFGVLIRVIPPMRAYAEQKEIDAWLLLHGRDALYNENLRIQAV